MKSLDFRIRKLHVTTDFEKKLQRRQASRLYVSEEAIIELTGCKDGGTAVRVEKVSTSSPPLRQEATLWRAPERLDKAITQMYDTFRDTCGYKLGDTVRVTVVGSLPDADEVTVQEVSSKDSAEMVQATQTAHWEWLLTRSLSVVDHVHARMVLKNFPYYLERTFVVLTVNGKEDGNGRILDGSTTVRIVEPTASRQQDEVACPRLKVTGVRGLDKQVGGLNDALRPFYRRLPCYFRPDYYGIVIHGGHGTGKSMLLDKIAQTGWGSVHRIRFKDKLSEVQETLQRARSQQPSMILVDELDRLIDKERSNRGAVIWVISEAMDELAAEAEAKGELPRVLIVATVLDYVGDMPDDLRRFGRLSREIYLPLPDIGARKEILADFNLRLRAEEEEETRQLLGEKTHAYNGYDLRALVVEARNIASTRYVTLHGEDGVDGVDGIDGIDGIDDKVPWHLVRQDYEDALRLVRPSAMRDINLKPPPIHWHDIGGQDAVKQALQRAVHLLTEPDDVIARFFDSRPKGFLLYGPPGCSKTMAAQAMVTESALNFLAVKGAELVNMYIGESERAVRRLFERARDVAPSIIFFDEIDSIAGQRAGFSHGGGSSSSSSSSHSGLNVLTTLLNEMDGFESMSGVVVLAATNRPQALDPALLRPGRFDELIYVGPPEHDARVAIFQRALARRDTADLDLPQLARLTDRCSGAELKAICRAAAMAAYERCRRRQGSALITMPDLLTAIAATKRQITPEMLRGFADWEARFKQC